MYADILTEDTLPNTGIPAGVTC